MNAVLRVLATAATAASCCLAQDPNAAAPKKDEKSTVPTEAPLVILTKAEQDALFERRLDGGMSYSFKQFANMFFVSSHIKLGCGVALSAKTEEIADMELQSPFPQSYRPTLREFCDAIALQASAEWKYDPASQFVSSSVPDKKEPTKDIVVLDFAPAKPKRHKPYEVTLARGWKTEDKGNWVMHIPPTFPVGMDIYEMGTYTAKKKDEETALLKRIPKDVALEWAQRVNPKATDKDLKAAKVGAFDAQAYERMVPSNSGPEVRWRHWVFMDGNRCYFIVSTIFPPQEKEIFPDVETMLKSFKSKAATP